MQMVQKQVKKSSTGLFNVGPLRLTPKQTSFQQPKLETPMN